MQAVARELAEEVGIEADIVGFNQHVEPIIREGDRVRAHFVIASFVARWRRGEPSLSEEVDEAAWIEPEECRAMPTTPELADILLAAAQIERAAP